MELKQAILERRSVRRFSDKPVSDKDIVDILETAVWAPSGTNLQPWYFVAVRSPEKREKVLALARGVRQKFAPYLQKRFGSNEDVQKQTLRFIETLGGAPVIILAFLCRDYGEDSLFACQQSVAAAIGNICLLAYEKELKTCWMTAPVTTGSAGELEREFGRGKGMFMGMVAMGYGEQPSRRPPRRKDRYTLV